MKVPENIVRNIMSYVKTEIEDLKYGRVIIEVIETSNRIDIVTENRRRFMINGEGGKEGK